MQDDCKQPFYSIHDTTKFDSEGDYCTGCRNVSYCQQQLIWNFHVLLTTFCFLHKILQTFLFSIHKGRFLVPREIESRAYAKFCGENKMHYEERESRNFRTTFSRTIMLNLLMK